MDFQTAHHPHKTAIAAYPLLGAAAQVRHKEKLIFMAFAHSDKTPQTVLVVEDDADIREMIAMILNDHGYRVLQAGSEIEAMTEWRNHGARISLLITDVCIPYRATGVELGKRLRHEKPSLKIIYTSGFGLDILETEGAVPEDFFFVPKPFKPEQLLATISNCVN